MAGTKRCFMTVRALKRLNERLLCDILRRFPDHLQAHGLRIPDSPDRDNLNYEAIRDFCMAGGMPGELEDVLFFVSILGTRRGQEQIEREARSRGRSLGFNRNGLTHADFAIQTWLHEWPKNRDLLEAAYAGARIYGKSSYEYNVSVLGTTSWRPELRRSIRCWPAARVGESIWNSTSKTF